MHKSIAFGTTGMVLAAMGLVALKPAASQPAFTTPSQQEYCDTVHEWQNRGGLDGIDPDLLAVGSTDPDAYERWCQ
ncbi:MULTISPECIES: hypothetical protein [Modicisalibacter]|uniref:Secreted protein n=1 Tax=Modicisalibacter tunisiensis TaxID=390637 RepID=A0ABS7X2Z7_9GAMM|nr:MULTISPECIES: hypothetical protein [Modicisalibacter]MBZ9538246.1 hypothetical protein [Modicisalibacter tunisiensis]MBZ9568342.1 hypothetical protein [Modicisalibacter tunisiensis]